MDQNFLNRRQEFLSGVTRHRKKPLGDEWYKATMNSFLNAHYQHDQEAALEDVEYMIKEKETRITFPRGGSGKYTPLPLEGAAMIEIEKWYAEKKKHTDLESNERPEATAAVTPRAKRPRLGNVTSATSSSRQLLEKWDKRAAELDERCSRQKQFCEDIEEQIPQ